MWLLLLPFLLSIGSGSLDYPIDPIPLRVLCDQAELILIVEAGAAREIDKDEYPNPGGRNPLQHKAPLRVVEVLRGEFSGAEVWVRVSTAAICPAPARFEEGKTHLVFLKRWEGGHYRATGLSYGSKVLDKAGVKAYRSAIVEYFKTLQIKSEVKQKAALLDWAYRLALDPRTRIEGALELNNSRYLPTGYSKKNWPFKMADLSSSKQGRLIDALEKTTTLGWAEEELVAGLGGSNDPRLTDLFLRLAERPRGSLLGKGGYLRQAVYRSGNKEAKRLFSESWEFHSFRDDGFWLFDGGADEIQQSVTEIAAIIREDS